MAEEIKPGQNGAGTGPASPTDPQPGEGKPAPSGQPEGKPEIKTFNEEQVNGIVSDRLNRDRAKLLKDYGVQSKEELDKLVASGKGYADLDKKYKESEAQRSELSDKMAFMSNNIKSEKEAEIKALFKGLGKDFTNEALVEMIKTHPEWVNSTPAPESKPGTVLKPLGNPQQPPTEETPEQRRKRLFGSY